jgi:murein DD-endopeptidase MepM/ murein hydrolase activator NlpD
VANHRADGRASVRKHRAVGGTHRDAALPAGAVKVGVLGVLATATIAAPLAAAAAGIDEAAPAEPVAQSALQPAAAEQAAAAVAPVALPGATEAEAAASEAAVTEASVEDRAAAEGDSASRSEERTAPADDSEDAEKAEDDLSTGIEVSVPEPEPVVTESEASAEGAVVEGEAAPASDSGYIRPASGPITSGYGGRIHPVLGYYKGHDGVDFGAACGAPVKAAKSGTVVAVEYHHASGNRVKIDHGNGVVTGYYHLQGFNTSVGATVSQGDVIGYVGSTGRSTGCHLHFAKMDEAGNYSNPMTLLR